MPNATACQVLVTAGHQIEVDSDVIVGAYHPEELCRGCYSKFGHRQAMTSSEMHHAGLHPVCLDADRYLTCDPGQIKRSASTDARPAVVGHTDELCICDGETDEIVVVRLQRISEVHIDTTNSTNKPANVDFQLDGNQINRSSSRSVARRAAERTHGRSSNKPDTDSIG